MEKGKLEVKSEYLDPCLRHAGIRDSGVNVMGDTGFEPVTSRV